MERDENSFTDIYGDETTHTTTPTTTAGAGSGGGDVVAVAAARAEVEAAEELVRKRAADREAAEDALADAEGAVAVAEAKVADYHDDPDRKEWQRAADREGLAKAKRSWRRAGEALGRADADLTAAQQRVESAGAELAHAEQLPVPPEPAPRFASLAIFVDEYVLPNWIHKLGENYGGLWCARWWEHPEAVTRLEALWEAFEVMRLETPPALSTWLRDHFDVHMRALTMPAGVFFNCSIAKHNEQHQTNEPWRADPPPVGMFPVNPDALIQSAPQTTSPASSTRSADPANSMRDKEMVTS